MDVTPYLESWRARQAEERERLEADTRRARADALRIAQLLREAGARRVWLIGSLARGTFQRSSDIDVLTEGLRAEQVTVLATRAAALAGRGVDVLRTEDLDPDWLAHHERWGLPLTGEPDGAAAR
jgi:predicted nucleotidyltransferase